MRNYITAMTDEHPHIDWKDLLPSMMLSYNCHVHRAMGDSPFFLTFAYNPRLPDFDIEKPRMFYDSSYVSDMYKISRAAHKAAKENLEEQRDRQEEYYNKNSKYRTLTPGDQVIIYYPNPPPGVRPKFHIFWKTFTVIEMVGRVNMKALQHNKRPIVVHIDGVLKFDASESKKEATENIHCIKIDLEAEREWARLDRYRALGQQEDEEEEEEAEVQWHIRRHTAGATQTLLTPSSSGTRQTLLQPRAKTPPLPPAEGHQEMLSTPSPPSPSGTSQQLLPPRVKKKKRRAEGKPPAKGKPPAEAAAQEAPAQAAPAQAAAQAEREKGAVALLRRAARAARAAAGTEQPEHWLDA
jgi:hypothetical protein